MTRTRPALSALVLAALMVLSPAARADDDDAREHEEARKALEQGLIRPLEEVIAEARKRVEGDLIEIELEREDGRYVYELEFIQPTGHVIELQLDANTLEIVEDD